VRCRHVLTMTHASPGRSPDRAADGANPLMNIKKIRLPEILGGIGLLLLFAGILRLVWEFTHPAGVGIIDCGSAVSSPEIGNVIHSDSACSVMVTTARLIAALLLGCGALMFGTACILALRLALRHSHPRPNS
jgi:hypothetical protein